MDQNPGIFARMKALAANLKPFLFKNTTDSQTVAKNTVWLSISNFGGRLLKAVIIIYAARVLDPVGWGVVSYAVTLAGFFTLFVDPGINVLLMREGSKAEEKHQLNLLSTTFYIKIILIAAVVIFVLFVGPAFTLLPGAALLLPVTALIIIGDTLREFFSSFIRAKESANIFIDQSLHRRPRIHIALLF
jgi:O-antigen/teichoic acid export membrane protein